jgi:folate receptor
MWDKSFKYTPDSDPAFVMWHFDASNSPNDAAAAALFGAKSDTCHLQYYHKGSDGTVDPKPTPEGDGFTECHPWKESACCHEETVLDKDTLRQSYGEGYEWDRCGKMSQECERFFVQEACLYECDANAGLYRLCSDDDIANGVEKDIGLSETAKCADDWGGNKWQIHNMPIKASYCDAWYDACYNDYFCGHGSYFECNKIYEAEHSKKEDDRDFIEKAWAVPVIVAGSLGSACAVALAVFACVLVSKERAGKAMFAALPSDEKETHDNDL